MPRELPRHLLAKGNYIRLAKSAVDPKYQGIGAILVGNHRDGLARLARALPDAEVRYYQAVAHWCLNDVAAANAALDTTDPSHAKLHSIINRKLRVLCQARHDGDPAWGISNILKKNPAFDVKTIGNMAMDDIQLGVNETIESVLQRLGNWRPDYYFVHMIEYRVIPIGVECAPFPVIFQSSDHRADYQQVMPLLDLCDAMLVLGEQAHGELARATKTRVFTYPKLFGINADVARSAISDKKEFDVFWSGNMLDESMYDKATFFSNVADELADECQIVFCNGKTSVDEYYNLLSRSRVVPSYIHREQDSFSSRALEAIAMGAIALVPSGNAIGLYFEEGCGLVECHSANAAREARHILTNWDNCYSASANSGRQRALEEFNFSLVVEQLFKMLLVESLKVAIDQRPSVPAERSQYRLYGRIEATDVYCDPKALEHYRTETYGRIETVPAGSVGVDFSSTCAYIAWQCGKREQAIAHLENMRSNSPNHMGILFNLGFAYSCLGRTDQAVRKFRAILSLRPEQTAITPLFALFDFSSRIYLTHMMRDELCNYLFGTAPIDGALSYLQSVSHNYLADVEEGKGNIDNAGRHYRDAIASFPENFIALANFGQFLLRTDAHNQQACDEARNVLVRAIELYRGYLLTGVYEAAKTSLEGSAEGVEQTRRSYETLARLMEEGKQLHTKGRNAWLELFREGGPSSLPQLVEEGFLGFNIVAFSGTVFGLAQAAGAIDLASASQEELDHLRECGNCYTASTLNDVKAAIIAANPSAYAERVLVGIMEGLQQGVTVSLDEKLNELASLGRAHPGLAPALGPILEELSKHVGRI